MKQEHTTGDCA